MVDITYRLSGPWGPGKGANLQPGEVDSNFWALAQAVVDLETNPAIPVGIESISMSGTSMTITLTDGTVMGPFLIPVLTFVWRGEWQPGTSYAELDVFKVSGTDGGIFMVLLAHTTGPDDAFDPALTVDGNPAYLQLFGSADATVNNMKDVVLSEPHSGDVLMYHEGPPYYWANSALGSMAYQDAASVAILGGYITGLPTPVDPNDAATKAYVDALPGSATAPDRTIAANISGFTQPVTPNTLTDILDYLVASVRGTLLFRGGLGWQALPPGAPTTFLQTNGPDADPEWAIGGSGVTAIYTGIGLAGTTNPISDSGTISLARIGPLALLANTSPTDMSEPLPVSVSMLLDASISSTRGTLVVRDATGWVGLAPGTSGQYLKTQGSGANAVWDNPTGTGTVTSVSAGGGLTTGGSPITGSGTISMAQIAINTLLGNITGSPTGTPAALTLTQAIDAMIGNTQGVVLYRGASAWAALAPGTSGFVLTTGGAGANPSWAAAPVTGSSIQNLRLVANISGSTALPTGVTLDNYLDAVIGSARGTMIYRGASGWRGLAAGTSGQVLQSAGSAADPVWATNGGGSLAISSPVARDILVYNSSSGKFENARPKYEIGCYVPGTMSASQNLLFHKFSKAVTLPANLGAYLNHNTVAGGSVAASGSTAITLARALAATPTSFATVATITFSAGSVTGSLSTQAAIGFAQGDVLRVRGPATADTTFADFHLSLVGFET